MLGRLLILAALFTGGVGSAIGQGDDSLYRALGAREGIQAIMRDFVGRLKTDARIGSFFVETQAGYLAGQLTDQICQLSGGPCELDGPSMKKAHEEMKIGKADFNVLVEVLQQTMDDRGVPFATQNRLLARLAPMNRDIVSK